MRRVLNKIKFLHHSFILSFHFVRSQNFVFELFKKIHKSSFLPFSFVYHEWRTSLSVASTSVKNVLQIRCTKSVININSFPSIHSLTFISIMQECNVGGILITVDITISITNNIIIYAINNFQV